MQKLTEGDRVRWTSQSQGAETTKVGEIFLIVPADSDPLSVYFRNRALHPALEIRFTRRFDGMSRKHESYLVEVKDPEHPKAKPILYWPRVKHLRLAKE